MADVVAVITDMKVRGLQHVPCQLFDASDSTYVATATTDENGRVEFTGLADGEYFVRPQAYIDRPILVHYIMMPISFSDLVASAHKTSHQDGGADELDIYNLDLAVGTATGVLPSEIVIGTSPGGELGGTWPSPTVDSLHSGTYHPITKLVTTDQTLNQSDTALQNVTSLVQAIGASETWAFEFHIFYDTSTGADFKVSITFPSSPTSLRYHSMGKEPVGSTFDSDNDATAGGTAFGFPGLGAGGVEMIIVSGYIVNGANAGNIQFQAAQNSSEASNTIVKAGSKGTFHRTA